MSDIVSRRPDGPEEPLSRQDLDRDPVRQLRKWLEGALAAGSREPNAMVLATSDRGGVPSARVVLLRGLDERGLTWYTNRESLKGRDLAANPRAAVVFHWELQQRQVRVAGDVSIVPEAEAAAYFAERPRKSQLSAWASPQGRALAERAELEAATERIDRRFPDVVPLPPFWGGYRLTPSMFEFWQGRRNRMHDRFSYVREEAGWQVERLAP
ncbi:MAG: pyridoxamine 5'-phosphate oxidase [Candidatus Limnocylindrales bacterium]